MGVVRSLSSLTCELKIKQARNVELKSPCALFVRFYLSAGNNKNIKLNTPEICSKSNCLFWNQTFSLECQGSQASIEELKQQSIIFELRHRKATLFLGRFCRSDMLGKGEISWKSVFESPGMKIERWVVMGNAEAQVLEDGKPPLLKIALTVQASNTMEMKKKKQKKEKLEDFCRCREYEMCNCADFEALVLAGQFEESYTL